MAQERDDLVYLAKLAEQAERFDEMVERRRWTHTPAARRIWAGCSGPTWMRECGNNKAVVDSSPPS